MISVKAAACSQRLVLHISAELYDQTRAPDRPQRRGARGLHIKEEKKRKKNVLKRFVAKLIPLTCKLHSHHETSGTEGMIRLKSIRAASLQRCVALECPKLHLLLSVVFFWPFLSAESAKASYPQSTQAMVCIWKGPYIQTMWMQFVSLVVMQSHDWKELLQSALQKWCACQCSVLLGDNALLCCKRSLFFCRMTMYLALCFAFVVFIKLTWRLHFMMQC